MSLTNEERQALVQRELEKAHEAYEDIEILKARGRWNGAANRLYYSVFHAVNALFINGFGDKIKKYEPSYVTPSLSRKSSVTTNTDTTSSSGCMLLLLLALSPILGFIAYQVLSA